jgi:hypothetical protein
MSATTGPVTRRNYAFRAEGYCARKSPERKGMHPTLTMQSDELGDWLRYFDYLGRRPWAFQRMLDWPDAGHSFTVPEEKPEWFDPDYADKLARTG